MRKRTLNVIFDLEAIRQTEYQKLDAFVVRAIISTSTGERWLVYYGSLKIFAGL